MAGETKFNSKCQQGFEGYWLRVENKALEGTSDVCYQVLDGPTGWLELKYFPKWAGSKGNQEIRINHLENSQVLFMFMWTKAGGNADLLLGVGTEIFLLPGHDRKFFYRAMDVPLSRQEYIDQALWYGDLGSHKSVSNILRLVYS